MQRVLIELKPKEKLKWSVHWRLSKWKIYKQNDGSYAGIVSPRRADRVRQYCVQHKIRFRLDNAFGQRSNWYRTAFFSKRKPDIGDRYFCAYCGRLLPRDKITVDHIYPVNQVSQNIRLQNRLKQKGLHDVNDYRNLAAACMSCNQKKSDHMGPWIKKGLVGRKRGYWTRRWIMRFCIIGIGCFILIRYAMGSTFPEIQNMLQFSASHIRDLAINFFHIQI